MWKYLFILILSVTPVAHSEVYLEAGFHGGGDELIDSTVDNINAGGGVKLALGIQNIIGDGDDKSITLALGYLFDSINAINGTAEFNVITFDAFFSLDYNYPHSFSLGLSYHMDPHYEDKVNGFAPTSIDFDDAMGFLLQYAYQAGNGAQVGVRFTGMDYEINNRTINASSLGFFISGAF